MRIKNQNSRFTCLCWGKIWYEHLLFNGVYAVHIQPLVPTAIQQESKLVHLKQVTQWRLVMNSRQRCELDNRRHFCFNSEYAVLNKIMQYYFGGIFQTEWSVSFHPFAAILNNTHNPQHFLNVTTRSLGTKQSEQSAGHRGKTSAHVLM